MMYGRHILLGCAERPGAESRVVLRVSRFIVAQGSIMAQRIRSSSSATCPQDSSIDRRTVIARDRLWPGGSCSAGASPREGGCLGCDVRPLALCAARKEKALTLLDTRSEARRVGKGCVCLCRSGWSRY